MIICLQRVNIDTLKKTIVLTCVLPATWMHIDKISVPFHHLFKLHENIAENNFTRFTKYNHIHESTFPLSKINCS